MKQSNAPLTLVNHLRVEDEIIHSDRTWATISEDNNLNFKDTIQLYQHQRTTIKSMADVEDARVASVFSNKYAGLTTGHVKIETSAMILSEPFGSGKTVMVLGLMLLRPIPRAVAMHLNALVIIPPKNRWANNVNALTYSHEIIRKFTGPRALIRVNLIVVGSAVLTQWENAIRDFTHLRVFVVGDYYKLVQLRTMITNHVLSAKYDVVLLKNGKVTGNIDQLGEGPRRDYRSMISVVGELTTSQCWARVVYDDFDTITIPPGSCAINALFTIYVSASAEQSAQRTIVKRPVQVTFANITEAIMASGVPLSAVAADPALTTTFNVRNEATYIEDSIRIPIINGFRYVYANPDDNYIRLLGVMGDGDAERIMEMLNGDAVSTAASELGLTTTSVADIFQRMLNDKYDRYIHAQKVLETIHTAKARLEEHIEREDGRIEDPRHPPRQHTAAEIAAIRSALLKKTNPKIEFSSVNLVLEVDQLMAEWELRKDEDGLAISRVIDNVKEGECQICRLPLEGCDTFIVKCCGLIVCDLCGIKGNQIGKRYDYKLKAQTISGSCANCKATIYPMTDLLFLDRNFDITALLDAKGDESEPIVEIVAAPTAEPVVEPTIKNPKLRALLAICTGGIPEAREEHPINIPQLIKGIVDIPGDNHARKVLVFANYNETLNMVENFLVEESILFLRLGGTYQAMADTVKQFVTYGTVMLINSEQTCAGLNMQFATDLVFMHKIMNGAIESQVAGRIQRIGRTCNARIHYLCYKNEKTMVQ